MEVGDCTKYVAQNIWHIEQQEVRFELMYRAGVHLC